MDVDCEFKDNCTYLGTECWHCENNNDLEENEKNGNWYEEFQQNVET